MFTSRAAIAALSLSFATASHAAFTTPDAHGWSRGSARSVYAEWDVFTSPFGGNTPDVGLHPSPLPTGWVTPDVSDASGSSFVTSGGNIYSFSAPLEITAVVPNFNAGPAWVTTILVQTRTQGSEINPNTVRIGSYKPVEVIELLRQPNGGMGGVLVETLWKFEIRGNAASYAVEFAGAASSLSLDRIAIDTKYGAIRPTFQNGTTQLPAQPIPVPSSLAVVGAGAALVFRRRR
jgi:uncharacterized protein (TIGR03382 family)